MIEGGSGPGLENETTHPTSIRGHIRRQNFESDRAIQSHVAAQVDLSHPARSEQRDHFVVRDVPTDHNGSGSSAIDFAITSNAGTSMKSPDRSRGANSDSTSWRSALSPAHASSRRAARSVLSRSTAFRYRRTICRQRSMSIRETNDKSDET